MGGVLKPGAQVINQVLAEQDVVAGLDAGDQNLRDSLLLPALLYPRALYGHPARGAEEPAGAVGHGLLGLPARQLLLSPCAFLERALLFFVLVSLLLGQFIAAPGSPTHPVQVT